MIERKIKILLTIPNFDTAGSGKVLYDLAKGLDKNLFEVEIACGSKNGSFFKTVEELNLPIHIFETKTSYRPHLTLLKRVFRISNFYKKHNFDIIHSWQWSSDWTEALAAKLAGVKWIYTKKAMGFESYHWRIKSWLADFIITINEDMKDYFPNKKAQKLIPLGIDTDYYSPDHFIKTHSDIFSVITVVNLVRVKGIEVLLKAIKKLSQKQIQLTIIGDYNNEYGSSLIELSKNLQIQNQVLFLGKIGDVRPYLVNSDLYVIPTLDEGRREGMPIALVEAMSMGIPVLGSNISGIKFVLQNYAEYLFPANNSKVLSNKIHNIMLMNTNERREIGIKLRYYCIINFGIENFIRANSTVYTHLIKEK